MSREKSGTRNYHWNVVGPQFNDLHTFFEAQYNALNTVVDDVAERARALDGNAIGTWQNFVEHARRTEHPGQYRQPARCWRTCWRIMKPSFASLNAPTKRGLDGCEQP